MTFLTSLKALLLPLEFELLVYLRSKNVEVKKMGAILFAFLMFQNPSVGDLAQAQPVNNSRGGDQTEGAQKPAETPPPQNPEEVLHPVETKQLPSTGRKIFTNFWYDQKSIWTSPAHITRKDAKWWVIFGGGTAVLIATDRRTSKSLPNTVSQVSFSNNVSQIGAVYTTLPVAGALYLYGKTSDDPHAREAGVLGTEALLDSFILSSVLKFGAGRERPNFPGGNGRFFQGQRSFPSGHAMMTWSFASLIAHEYKGGKVVPTIAYSLASVVSVARFTSQKHFASDIVAGGSMGWFIGKFVFEHHLDAEIHKRYDTNGRSRYIPEISPSMDPRSHTYALSLQWNPADLGSVPEPLPQ
jgi:membrane-associated phospholipid phosphatase